MPKEQRKPTENTPQSTLEGRDEMIKASINLQDLRKRIFIKAKTEKTWRFWGCMFMSARWRHFGKPIR
jgi:hypothetical protein